MADPTLITKIKAVYGTLMEIPFLKNIVGGAFAVVFLTMYLEVKSDRDHAYQKLAIYESGTIPQIDSIIQKNKDQNIILLNDIKESQLRLDSLISKTKKDTLTLDEAMSILKGLK